MNKETREQFEKKLADLKESLEFRMKRINTIEFEINYISKLLEEK